MSAANIHCPSCGYRFSWAEKWRFTQGIGIRKASDCPCCNESLIYAEAPFYLMSFASLGLFSVQMLTLTLVVLESKRPAGFSIAVLVLSFVFIAMAMSALRSARLERAEKLKPSVADIPAE